MRELLHNLFLSAAACAARPPWLPRFTNSSPSPSSLQSAWMEKGVDSDGIPLSSRSQLWAKEAGEDASSNTCFDPLKKQQWYNNAVSYWEGVEASVNGVLGGYGHVSDRDVSASDGFLVEVLSNLSEPFLASKNLVALDCGAGVGRVSKNLLLRHFHEVDLVEPVSHFLEAAKTDLKAVSPSSSVFGRAINFYCKPLQEFTPEANRYDVIWVQWCIGHLTDHDFIEFFERAKVGLKPSGFFVVKENMAKTGFVVDKEDSSVTRSDTYYRDLFEQAGLFVHKSKVKVYPVARFHATK